ncbi:MAG: hypothetical protein F4179_06970 [Gammaproteobacteria bacterium]|nr:hypothetical protein [Gammaproteobacteria bacterium]MYF61401.1 hypothetical protein [Gammaproteobacteria bacterium]MYI21161.1 hypothetical protein [Gammaproteobacteria bacterium]
MRVTSSLLTLLVALALAGGVELSAQAGSGPDSADPEAMALVDAWIESVGGMEAYAGFHSARYTFTTELYDPETGRMRRARPRYVTIARTDMGELARIDRWEGNDYIEQGWDGVADWALRNGEPLEPGDRDRDEVRYVSGDVNYWMALPFKLRDPGVHLAYQGRDAQDRHDVMVTFGQGVGSDVWHYYFQDGRTWPVEVTYQTGGTGGVDHNRWTDLRTDEGYPYVGARVHVRQGRVWKILRMSEVEINPDDLDMAVFSRP